MQYLKNTFILLVVTLFTFSSCSKDEAPATSNVLLQGRWKISLYVENGTDKLSLFNGYQFVFTDNGVVTATQSGSSSSFTGSWSAKYEDKQNKLNLNFGSTAFFSELNEDWKVVEKTNSKIRLEHSSGGNGGTDLLTFERL